MDGRELNLKEATVDKRAWIVMSVTLLLVGTTTALLSGGAQAGPPIIDPGDDEGGCWPDSPDADGDGRCDALDPCRFLYNPSPRACPNPVVDLQLEAGPGRPSANADWASYLIVWNASNYEYMVDRGQTSSHAYCPTCVADDMTSASLPHPPCGAWSGDYAVCSETSAPNPKSYGGNGGAQGSVSPCGTGAADQVLEVGENILRYSPFHNCCDITKDVLYAARLVINRYRSLGDAAWRDFPQPLPIKTGWATRGAVDVGFPAGYPRNYEAFTVEAMTTPGCPPQHYATSDLDTDMDGLPDACDCDDDNDRCLDGNDYTATRSTFTDTSKDPLARPSGCDTGEPRNSACLSYRRGFGTYASYPINCRGY